MFTMDQFPSTPGVYRFKTQFDRAIPLSIFHQYWKEKGKKAILEHFEGTPFVVGMFYKPGGFTDSGAPIAPHNTDWQETDFLFGDYFEQQMFAPGSQMAAWFEPGNVIGFTSKNEQGVDFVSGVGYYVIVREPIPVQQVKSEIKFSPDGKLLTPDALVAKTPAELGAGVVETLSIAVIAVAITGICALAVWFIWKGDGKVLVKKIKDLDKMSDRFVNRLGEKGKEMIQAARKTANEMIEKANKMADRIVDNAKKSTSELLKKATSPFAIGAYVVGAVGLGYLIYRALSSPKDDEEE